MRTLVLDASQDPSTVARAAWSLGDKPIAFQHSDRHKLSLDSAVAAIKSSAAPLGEAPLRRPDEKPESVRAYASAKARVLAGDSAGAITDLENALQEDPESLTLQSELGLLQVRAGRRTAGIATLRRAVDQGLRDANALRTLAKEEARSGNTDQALLLLATALGSPGITEHSLMFALIRTDLGERLADAEYFGAAHSVLAELAGVNVESFADADLRSQDASDFIRRRPGLLLLAGDIAVLDEQWSAATQCYGASLRLSAQSTAQTRLRAAGVALRTGQTAQAALQVHESLGGNAMPQPWHEDVASALKSDASVSNNLKLALLSGIAEQPPTIRMARVTLAASCTDNAAAATLLEQAMIEFGADDAALDRMLDALDNDKSKPIPVDRICDTLARICDAHPSDAERCAQALVRHGRSIQLCQSRLAARADTSIGSGLLAASLSMFYNDPESALATLERTRAGIRITPELQLASIKALNQQGKTDEARDNADILASNAASSPINTARAFVATRQPQKSLETLSRGLDPATADQHSTKARIDMLVVASQAAALASDAKSATDYLARAAQLDPASDEIASRRFALVASEEKTLDEQAAAIIIRDIRDANPSSRWLRQLLARDLTQRGLSKAAQSELESLVDDRGEPAAGLALQVDYWQKDKAATSSAIQRLTAQLRTRPDSPSLTVALSRLLASTGKPQEAHDLLAAQYEKFPLDEFARFREDLLRTQLGKPDEADRLLVARLQKRPTDFATGIELTQSLFAGGSFQRGTESLRTLLASNQLLTPAQVKAAATLLNFLTPAAVAKAGPDSQTAALEAVELLHSRKAVTTLEQASDRAELISIVRPLESSAILDAIEYAASIDNRISAPLKDRIAQRLFTLESATPGLRLLEELNMRTTPPNAMLGREWIAQTVSLGNIEDVTRLIKNWKDGEHLAQSLAQLQLSPDFAGQPIEESRTEFAYFIAGVLTTIGRDTLSAQTYRLVLELDPKHTWASNNFGYMILERGGSIEEAAALIEQAHEAEPDAPSIIDSLGWLRYKQGLIEDSVDANGNKREGAVTLLEMALNIPQGETNWEMQDHLADALWRRNQGDDRERAQRCWRTASALLRDELSFSRLDMRNQNNVPPMIAEMISRQKDINAKSLAVSQGEEPKVAEMSIPKEFKPRPEPPRERFQQRQPARQMLVP